MGQSLPPPFHKSFSVPGQDDDQGRSTTARRPAIPKKERGGAPTTLWVWWLTVLLVLPLQALPAGGAPAPSDYVSIWSDSAFTADNGVTRGTGTPSDPFVIENLTFDLGAGGHLAITGTTAHFVIRNLRFVNGTGAQDAISLQGVQNGRIEDVTIDGAKTGIRSFSAGFGVRDFVMENLAIRNGSTGIEIQTPLNVSVLNSTFENFSYEFMRLAYGGSARVVGNHFTNSSRSLSLWQLDSLVLESNTMVDAGGPKIEDVAAGTVASNDFAMSWGMSVLSSHDLVVHDNLFRGPYRADFNVRDSHDLSFDHNVFEVGGISLDGDDYANYGSIDVGGNNSAGGLPIVYRRSCSNETFDPDAVAQLILVGCDRVLLDDGSIQNTTVALTVAFSSNITASRVSIANVTQGVQIVSSDHVAVQTSRFANTSVGISAGPAPSLSIYSDTFDGWNTGLQVSDANDATIARNEFAYGSVGIGRSQRLNFTGNNVTNATTSFSFVNSSLIQGNHWSGANRTVTIEDSNQGLFQANRLENNSARFVRVSNFSIDDLSVSVPVPDGPVPSSSYPPVTLQSSREMSFNNTTLVGGGIRIGGTLPEEYDTQSIGSNVTVAGLPVLYRTGCSGDELRDGRWGQVILASCHDVTVSNVSLAADGGGLTLAFADRVLVANGTFDAADFGVLAYNTSNLTLRDNSVQGVSWALTLVGGSYVDVFDNTLHGRGSTWVPPPWNGTGPAPDYVIYHRGGGIQAFATGPINIWGNHILSCGAEGIHIPQDSGAVQILSNVIEDTTFAGIDAWGANLTIAGNTIRGVNGTGIQLYGAPGAKVSSNEVADSAEHGIWVYSSPNANVSNNRLERNGGSGLRVNDTLFADFFGNAFVSNVVQAEQGSSNLNWTASYPTGGNYWSDYVGQDSYGGPLQDQAGADGIGDTPYANGSVTDTLPLMSAPALPAVADPEPVAALPLRTLSVAYAPPVGPVNGTLAITVNVTGAVGNVSVVLHWRLNGTGPWQEQQLVEGPQGTFLTSLALPDSDAVLGFYIEARDTSGAEARSPGTGAFALDVVADRAGTLSLAHTPPASATAGSPVTLVASPSGMIGNATVTLYWRADGSTLWSERPMSPGASGDFSATIDVPPSATGLEYYFEASDEAGHVLRDPPQGAVHIAVNPTPPPPNRQTPTGIQETGFLVGAVLAAALVVVLTFGTERGSFRIGWMVIGRLFPRLKRETVLGHFVRGRLYQVISQTPGVHFSELRRTADVSSGTATHHLHVLEENGYIRSEARGTLVRFYPTRRPLDENTYTLDDGDQEVLEAVRRAPGISEEDLAARLERHPAAVRRHVESLRRLGYLERPRPGGRAGLVPRKQGGP